MMEGTVRDIRELMRAEARDDFALHVLRHDPEGLARSLDLPAGHATSLRSADRFFDTERAILDRAVATATRLPCAGNGSLGVCGA